MPQRIYNGPCPAVNVVLPGGTKTVERGEKITVPAAVAVNLDEQGDWLSGEPRSAAKSKKAPSGGDQSTTAGSDDGKETNS